MSSALVWMDDGWLNGVKQTPSANHDDRPSGTEVTLIVIHAISLPPRQYGSDDIASFFTNRIDPDRDPYFQTIHQVRVSAHFVIYRTGVTQQFVSCDRRAWHAGASTWRGRSRCNDYSIGIELEGCDEDDFDARQYDALVDLIRAIAQRYPHCEIVGHSDIAPDRKTDPGPRFDWARLSLFGTRVSVRNVAKGVLDSGKCD